jgi:hypothetical protein
MLAISGRLYQKLERRAIGADGLLAEIGGGVGAGGVVEAFKLGTVRSGHGGCDTNDEDKGTHHHHHLERRGYSTEIGLPSSALFNEQLNDKTMCHFFHQAARVSNFLVGGRSCLARLLGRRADKAGPE